MISLKFIKVYKSLLSFNNTSIPDFTLITGVNGAGKTQLLQSIQQGFITANNGQLPKETIRFLTPQNLVPNNSGEVRREALNQQITNTWNNIQTIKNQLQQTKQNIFQGNYLKQAEEICTETNKQLSKLEKTDIETYYSKLPAPQKEQEVNNLWSKCNSFKNSYNSTIQQHSRNNRNTAINQAIKVISNINKDIDAIELDDLYKNTSIIVGNIDIFQQNFSNIFKAYHFQYEQNEYKRYRSETKRSENIDYYSDAEFVERFGNKPWNFVNKIFVEAKLDYQISNPENNELDTPFTAILINKINGAKINFNDLSSGEKVLMSFALSLYNSKTYSNFPKLLLLDEPDASLHPSMTKHLLSVIQKVFVQEKGIKVIMTTHSPSTIAFAPEEAIFLMNKNTPRLQKVTKANAITHLTQGFISITSNTQFILVEDRFDVNAYSKTFNLLQDNEFLNTDLSLVFVPTSNKRDKITGGSSVVKAWITKMFDAGMNNLRGLIDMDTSNIATDNIKTLNRYSIENYLLDPIIVYALLIDKGLSENIEGVHIEKKNYYAIVKLNNELLQKIADNVLQKVKLKYATQLTNEDKVEITYVNGMKINVPKWFVETRGHDLVNYFRQTFVTNNNKVVISKELDELLDMVSRLPEFISYDFINIFNSFNA